MVIKARVRDGRKKKNPISSLDSKQRDRYSATMGVKMELGFECEVHFPTFTSSFF